jgi:excisionase family DNA binding protein
MVRDGRLHAYRVGGRMVRFRRYEVEAALEPSDVA